MADAEDSGSLNSKPKVTIQKSVQYSELRSVSSHSLLPPSQLTTDNDPLNNRGSLPPLKHEVNSSGKNTPSKKESITIFEHLHRHASSFGLNSMSKNSESHENHIIINIPNQSEKHNKSLSWKKLHILRPKLKTASNTSALMAGFAMASVVELQLSKQQVGDLPAPLLIGFALCTSLLVAVQILVLLISTCILPLMEGVCNLHSVRLVHESPHERLQRYIEFAWICSTILGILLFMIEVAIVCWIQFYNVLIAAAYVTTAVFLAFLCIFVWFGWIFYQSIMKNTCDNRQSDIQNLERMRLHINEEF